MIYASVHPDKFEGDKALKLMQVRTDQILSVGEVVSLLYLYE